MRAIVLAYHEIGCTGIEALLAHGFDIAGVLTHADDPHETAGSGRSPSLPRATACPCSRRRIRITRSGCARSASWRPTCCSPSITARCCPTRCSRSRSTACFNLHGSLLPAYRGRAPANWAILNGETETGVTLHHMTTRADAGDIVGQRRVPITPADDARTLNLKLADAARELLGQTSAADPLGHRAADPAGRVRRELLRPAHARGRRDRLAQARKRHRESRARGHAPVPGRVHLHARGEGARVAGRGAEERHARRGAGSGAAASTRSRSRAATARCASSSARKSAASIAAARSSRAT